MRVSEWGNDLAIRLPKELVRTLGLKAGDEIEVVDAAPTRLVVGKEKSRDEAITHMRNAGWDLPSDYRFNRDEANQR